MTNEVSEVVPAEILKLDPEQYTTAVFASFRTDLEAYAAAAGVVTPDATTTAGMKQCIALRAEGRSLRVMVEKTRRERKAPILEIGKLLDDKARKLTAEIVPLEDRFDEEIQRVEAAREAERQAAIDREHARIAGVQEQVANLRNLPAQIKPTPSVLKAAIAALTDQVIDAANFGEFAEQANAAREETLGRLHQLHDAAVEHEAREAREKAAREAEAARLKSERAELDAQRAAQAEAARAAEAERAKVEAEAKAKRDAADAELRAQRAAFEAEQRAAREILAREKAAVEQARKEQGARAEAERQAELRKQREAENVAKAKAAEEAEKAKKARLARRPTDREIVEVVRSYFAEILTSPLGTEEVIDWLAHFDAELARYDAADKAA